MILNYKNPFWQRRAFNLAMGGAILFLVLTLIAMLIYPGGTQAEPYARGYSFFENFFSELGFVTTPRGAPNLVDAILFFIALSSAGLSLLLFFIAFGQFFQANQRQRLLSTAGMIVGSMSGICFIGVAFTPADLFMDAHVNFVLWAFRLFPLAVILYAGAIFIHPGYPQRYGWLCVAFTICLVGYIVLMELGPSAADTHSGLVIQATGQKIIVYLSLVSVLLESYGAKKFLKGEEHK